MKLFLRYIILQILFIACNKNNFDTKPKKDLKESNIKTKEIFDLIQKDAYKTQSKDIENLLAKNDINKKLKNLTIEDLKKLNKQNLDKLYKNIKDITESKKTKNKIINKLKSYEIEKQKDEIKEKIDEIFKSNNFNKTVKNFSYDDFLKLDYNTLIKILNKINLLINFDEIVIKKKNKLGIPIGHLEKELAKIPDPKTIEEKYEYNPKKAPYVNLLKVIRPEEKDPIYIIGTSHAIPKKYYQGIHPIIKDKINKAEEIYFELSPYEDMYEVYHGTLDQINKKLKNTNIKELGKKLIELRDKIANEDSSLEYNEYNKNHMCSYISAMIKYLILGYPIKDFHSIENEIFKIALKNKNISFKTLDPLLNISIHNQTYEGKPKKSLYYKDLEINRQTHHFINLFKSKDKIFIKDLLVKTKDYISYNTGAALTKKLPKDLYEIAIAFEAYERNESWTKDILKAKPFSVFAGGIDHLTHGKEKSLKALLEKEGCKVTHALGEETFEKYQNKITKANEYNDIINLCEEAIAIIPYNYYYLGKLYKLTSEKLKKITSNEHIKKAIKKYYNLSLQMFGKASKVDIFIGYTKDQCLKNINDIKTKLK